MEGTLQESRNVEHVLILLCLAQGAGQEVSCLKMNKVNNLHCGCHGIMEHTKQRKERKKKEAEPLKTHTCEQQGFIAASSHQVKQDRDVPPLGRDGFMPVGPANGELPPPGSVVSLAVQKNIICVVCLERLPSLTSECMFYSGVIMCKG